MKRSDSPGRTNRILLVSLVAAALLAGGLSTASTAAAQTAQSQDRCATALSGSAVVNGEWGERGDACHSVTRYPASAKYYTFRLDQSSVVQIDLESEVDAYLYLRSGDDERSRSLQRADDDGGQGTNSKIWERLEAGSYTIEATTYYRHSIGGFRLTLEIDAQDASPETTTSDGCAETLSSAGAVDGVWAPGCQSSEPNRGYAKYYTFTLSQRSTVTIDLTSSVDTYLYLRSGANVRSGPLLRLDDDGGRGSNSQIRDQLAAGSYTIEATTYRPNNTGSFRLALEFSNRNAIVPPSPSSTPTSTPSPTSTPAPSRPPTTNPVTPETTTSDGCGETLSGPGPVDGAWSTDSCQSSEPNRGYAKYYTFTLSRRSTVTIDLTSSVDTYLYLRSGADERSDLFTRRDDDGGQGRNSRITEQLAAGSYTIEATTFRPNNTGSFRLTLAVGNQGAISTSTPAPASTPSPTATPAPSRPTTNPVTPETPASDECAETLTSLGSVDGAWAPGCQSQGQTGGYAKYYTFSLDQAAMVQIDLESSEDPFLYLRPGEDSQSGVHLHFDDDGGQGRNSRISERLAAGSYTIEATTYHPNTTGSFRLTVEAEIDDQDEPETPASDECGETLSGSGSVDGAWAADGCRSSEQYEGYAKYYTFTLPRRSAVTIDLTSSVDTYLFLRSGADVRSGSLLISDDDGGQGSNSRISEELAAGSYTIEATTYRYYDTGSFRLTLGVANPDAPASADGCTTTLTSDGVVAGEWTRESCRSLAQNTPRASRGYAKYYTFTLAQRSTVTIDLASSVDNKLHLRSGANVRSGSRLGTDGSGRDGHNASMRRTLAAGSYTIEATTDQFRNSTGSFIMRVTGLNGTASVVIERSARQTAQTPLGCGNTITGNGTVSGQWNADANCVSSGWYDGSRNHYARYFTFTLTQPSVIQIDLESRQANAYLRLRRGSDVRSGSVVVRNDNVHGGNTLNSRINVSLRPGTYTIDATTSNGGQTGSFDLTVAGIR